MDPRFEIDYKKIERNARIEALKDVCKNIDEPYMRVKISNECIRWNETYMVVKNRILDNELYQRKFIVDPIKQSMHENIAIKELSKRFNDIEKLPNKGKNAVYLHNGELKYGKNCSNIDMECTKSFDFISNDENGVPTFFAHKYINEAGGSQSNQHRDMLNFVHQGSKVKGNIKIICICEGNFYDTDTINLLRDNANKNVLVARLSDFRNDKYDR